MTQTSALANMQSSRWCRKFESLTTRVTTIPVEYVMAVKKNPAVDNYIDNAADFAQPILKRLRSAFHRGCPELEETIKWGIPTFEHQGILGSIAAFKKHVAVGFWKSKEMNDPAGILARRAASMCNIRFESTKDVPKVSVLADYVRQAVELNSKAANSPKRPKKAIPVPRISAAFKKALAASKSAESQFKSFTASQRRDYIEWIADAKREETKTRRIQQAVEWIADGKTRNWKYQRKK